MGLRQLIHSTRDEVYLTSKIVNLVEQQRFAGLHLDEFQGAGRNTTAENRRGLAVLSGAAFFILVCSVSP